MFCNGQTVSCFTLTANHIQTLFLTNSCRKVDLDGSQLSQQSQNNFCGKFINSAYLQFIKTNIVYYYEVIICFQICFYSCMFFKIPLELLTECFFGLIGIHQIPLWVCEILVQRFLLKYFEIIDFHKLAAWPS